MVEKGKRVKLGGISPFQTVCLMWACCAFVTPRHLCESQRGVMGGQKGSNSAESTVPMKGKAVVAERRDKAVTFGRHVMRATHYQQI